MFVILFFRNNSVTPINQVLTALRFYACGSHQNCIADFMGVNQSTVSRIVTKVTRAIANLCPRYIKMPTNEDTIHTENKFYQVARFPGVLGCIDGTHVRIQSPGE